MVPIGKKPTGTSIYLGKKPTNTNVRLGSKATKQPDSRKIAEQQFRDRQRETGSGFPTPNRRY
jgi:hypothetical protein